MTPPTIDDMIRAVGREVAIRRACYPNLVKANHLTQKEADHQIACMDAVYALLEKIKASTQVTL